ncbi:OmpA family protein [Luteimonas sp. e5]
MPLLPVSAGDATAGAAGAAAGTGHALQAEAASHVTRGDARSADIYFALGSSQLSVNDGEALSGVIASLHDDPGLKARVSGFHDASGDPGVNAEIAKQRAQNVADALAAAGIDPARIELDKPMITTGSGDPAHARRVEVRLD